MPLDYHLRYAELTELLEQLVSAYPQLAAMKSIGKTYEGRDIWLIRLTGLNGPEEDQRAAFVMDGGIHAPEVASTLAVLHCLQQLLEGYANDPTITALLDAYTVYAIPRINCDGAERFLTTPGRVRGSTEPFYPAQCGIVPQDINQDGDILQMRIPDPAGAWKIADFDSRVMERRRPDDMTGPFYTVVPEGLVAGEDCIELREAPPREGLDPNRQFPFDWSPSVPDELGQNTSGPAPLHDREVQVLYRFVNAHPNMVFEMNFHTFGGLHISPLAFCPAQTPPDEDAQLYAALGDMLHTRTGYQVQGIFPPGAMDIAHGSYTTWLYWSLGIPAYVTELWDFHRQADPERPEEWSMFFQSSREQFVREETTALKWDEQHNGGNGFVDWKPFRHPQLGEVEIGGWKDKFTRWNPPEPLLPGVLDKAWSTVLCSLLTLPRLRVTVRSTTWSGEHAERCTLEADVMNTGFLPSSGSRQAVLCGLGNDLCLSVCQGDKILDEACLGALDGYSHRRVLLNIAAMPGETVSLILSGSRCGRTVHTITLEAGDTGT